jgi:hypothetical protein
MSMADPTQEAASETTTKKKSPMVVIAVAVSGMLGVTAGMAVIAPKVLGSRPAEAGAVEEAADDGHGGGEDEGSHGAASEASGTIMELGNILDNPA